MALTNAFADRNSFSDPKMPRHLELRPGMRAISPLAPDVFVVQEDGRVTAYRVGIAMMEFDSLDRALDRYQLRRDDLQDSAPR